MIYFSNYNKGNRVVLFGKLVSSHQNITENKGQTFIIAYFSFSHDPQEMWMMYIKVKVVELKCPFYKMYNG